MSARLVLVLGVALMPALLAGCASEPMSVTNALPSLSRIPERLLSKDEQKQAVQKLNADKDNAEAEALKQIERRK